MEFVKKNWVSLACGVIVLIALVLAFFPTRGWITALQAAMDKQKATDASLSALLTKPRTLPTLDLAGTNAQPLNQFPTRAIIDAGTKIKGQMHDQAGRVYDMAVRFNQHKLLVDQSLPLPGAALALQFRDQYRDAMMQLIPDGILNATRPPTQGEVQAAKDKLYQDKYVPQIITVSGQPINKERVDADYQAEAATWERVLQVQAARSHKVYMLPEAMPISAAVSGAQTPNPSDIFFAQRDLWIYQDIAQSVAATNAPYPDVVSAPVKQIVQVAISAPGASSNIGVPGGPGMMLPGMGGQQPAAADTATQTPPPDPAQSVAKNFSVSPTGRVSNGLYDVVPFSLIVYVDAAQADAFLLELERNKFITVASLDLENLDPTPSRNAGFIFGDRPVVQLTLQCEALMLRAWTQPYMPDTVKKLLGVGQAAS